MDIHYYKQYEPIFGAWHITRLIGEGSFGKVFEIVREDFGVTYKAALKAITVPASEAELLDVKADGLDDKSVRAYFGGFVEELVKEFALMSRLKGNSNIVSYENHQVIEHKNGIGWDILIQMELLTPLNQYTARQTVTQRDVIRLGADLCRALELCQRYHIIHRDVKPENIFVSETGSFKLGDFGIARTVEKTTSGLSKKGTYTYMAPEVYKGEPYGATVDVYSLGIVLYRLLNGSRTPFLPAAPAPITHNDRENALARRLSGAPLPPPRFAQGRLAEIVLKACRYDPKERYQSAAHMREDLESLIARGGENPILERGEGFTDRSSAGSVTPSAQPIDRTQKDPPPSSGGGAIPAPGTDKTVSDFTDRRPPQGGEAGTSPVPETDKTVSDFADRLPPQGGEAGQNGVNPPVNQSAPKQAFPVWLIALLASVGVVLFAAFGLLVSSFGGTPAADPPSKTGTAAASSASQETADSLHGVPAKIKIGDYLETGYDSEGRVVEQPNFEFDGSVSRDITVYGEDGKIQYSATYNLLGELESFTLPTYDETMTRFDSFNRFGELEQSRITYLENGSISRADYLDKNGDLTSYTLYTYSDDESIVKNVSYYADGSFASATDLEYNADDVLFGQCELDENGALLSYSRYEWDENGRRTSHTIYADDDRPLSRTEFDSLSRTVKELTYGDSGEIKSQNEYVYDDGGFRIRLEQSAGDGSLETYTEYEYSESGKQSSLRRYKADGTPEYEAAKDHWGNILSSVYYDDDGSVTTKRECVYDEKGRLITETSYGADDRISFIREYNEDGLTTRYSWYSEGSLSYTEETEYDENGEVIKSSTFEPNGSLRSYTLFVRDDSGKLTQESEYRSDNTLSRTIDYNEEGLTVKSTSYDEEGELEKWTEYSHDENGNQIEIIHYLADGSLDSRQTWEYNENGDPIRRSEYDEKNALSSYTEYTYNAAGNCTKMSGYSGDGTLKNSYVYEYDDQGNKIKTSAFDQAGALIWYEIMEYDEDGSFLNSTTYDADGTPW